MVDYQAELQKIAKLRRAVDVAVAEEKTAKARLEATEEWETREETRETRKQAMRDLDMAESRLAYELQPELDMPRISFGAITVETASPMEPSEPGHGRPVDWSGLFPGVTGTLGDDADAGDD